MPAQAPSAGSDKPASAVQLSTNLVVGASNSSAALPLGTGSVLTLSGNGNYLELPPEPFSRLDEATLECWVKWHTFAGNEHVFEFDAAKRIKVGNRVGQPDLEHSRHGSKRVCKFQDKVIRSRVPAYGVTRCTHSLGNTIIEPSCSVGVSN